MIKQAVLDKLSALTEIEKEQQETGQFVNDLSPYTLIKTADKRVVNKRLLSHHSIYLSKQIALLRILFIVINSLKSTTCLKVNVMN